MPRTRLGVALLVPEPHRTEIDALRRAVADGSLGRVPAHLTLVPPVNVNDDRLGDAFAVLRDAAAASTPFALELGPTATFLPDNPVLFLEVGGEIEALQDLRARVFREPLERKLSWPFVPHVTLCDEGPPERIEAAARALADFRASVVLDRVHLLREETVDEERVWRPFADASLGAARVVGRGGLELEIVESDHLEPEARTWTDVEWELHEANRGTPWNEVPFALTARREGEIVGVALGWTNAGVGHLSELMVATTARRQGVGGHLLGAFEHLAHRRGCVRLSLRADAGSPAEGFYASRGWRVEATFDDWIGGRRTVQMRKDL